MATKTSIPYRQGFVFSMATRANVAVVARRTNLTQKRFLGLISSRWYLFICYAYFLALIVTLFSTSLFHTDFNKIQSELLGISAKQPNTIVNVIVQKQNAGKTPEQLVTQLGGRVTNDLPIISGFSAELPARNVPMLGGAEGVRWISLDGPVSKSNAWDTAQYTTNNYVQSINAKNVWQTYDGTGIGVAVVDSGIDFSEDFYTPGTANNRIKASTHYNTDWNQSSWDDNGHGTQVAGIIAGSGKFPNYTYVGVAPNANLINVKVSNPDGSAKVSSVIAGLQWVYDNRTTYNIRVVNISLNSNSNESYLTNPLCAAAELLWFNGIVVVAAAGNGGNGKVYAPANDPFVITVGATDEKNTTAITDDTLASFSAYGPTSDGVAKPDLVAPGKDIVSVLSSADSQLALGHPQNKVGILSQYFRMSGTSVSAPMVSGAVALLLQSNPNLTPDQVKYRLKSTATAFSTSQKAGSGYLNVQKAISTSTSQSANTGIKPSNLITTNTGSTWNSVAWNSVAWNSVAWNSVAWNSVAWNSVAWNSVAWNSVFWDN